MLETKTRRKVKSRDANAPSGVELEEMFTGKSVLHQPEDAPWSKIINAIIGKTINKRKMTVSLSFLTLM